MALTRWTPFNTFTMLDREMRAMMDRVLGSNRWVRPLGTTTFGEGTLWRPVVDVYRQDQHLIVRCELPGIDPESDLDITVEGNVLRIRGQKSFETKVEDGDLYLSEAFYGSFQRDVLLPEGIDADRLEANYQAGVLTVRIPLPAELLPQAHKVPITVGDQKAITAS